MFCRLAAVYVVSETSNIEYDFTTYYYTTLFGFYKVILVFRHTCYSFSSGREMRVIRVTRKLTGYGLIGQQTGLCQFSTLDLIAF